MKRTARLNKCYIETRDNIIANNEKKVADLKKQIAYEEMREATGTKNTQSLLEMIEKRHPNKEEHERKG